MYGLQFLILSTFLIKYILYRQKRALWNYCTDRAVIAARWTWLQAQIADIEYRIRLHAELQKQIRTNKGSFELENLYSSCFRTCSETNEQSTINGYRGQLPSSSVSSAKSITPFTSNEIDETDHCARTKPLREFKKRKLLQISGLHAISKRAARPSNIKCGCIGSGVHCAICTGRNDPTCPRDASDTLSITEKISLLDPSFHPVFSLTEGKFCFNK